MQDYASEFRKKSLMFCNHSYTLETLLKYVGGLHYYLRHRILMFNPTNIDEVSVQDIHLEASTRNDHSSSLKESL